MGKILVIDDEPSIRRLLRRVLETAGHKVFEAADGKQGIRRYHQVAPDLVITDIVMGEREGLECIQELRLVSPAMPIIAMSGGMSKGGLDVLALATRFGATRTFPKPLDLAAVLSAVREELAVRRAA